MNRAGAVPFVIGQWVCGAKFYGRSDLLAQLREGPRRWCWIAGLRRIGKTSLLKELDFRASREARPCLSLFWDFQGIDCAEDLALSFCDALLDAEESLERLGIPLGSVEDPHLPSALEKLRTALERRSAELLLLLDEMDEGVPLEGSRPGLGAELWQRLAGFEGLRVVAASSVALADRAAREGSARRLVEPFREPRLLGALDRDDARSLLLQDHLPEPSGPCLGNPGVETLLDACGDHPMLLQMAGKRCLELGDAEEALRQMEADRSVHHLLAVDFELLSEAERQILRDVAGGGDAPVRGAQRLVDLGVLRRRPGGFAIPNHFLASWLRR